MTPRARPGEAPAPSGRPARAAARRRRPRRSPRGPRLRPGRRLGGARGEQQRDERLLRPARGRSPANRRRTDAGSAAGSPEPSGPGSAASHSHSAANGSGPCSPAVTAASARTDTVSASAGKSGRAAVTAARRGRERVEDRARLDARGHPHHRLLHGGAGRVGLLHVQEHGGDQEVRGGRSGDCNADQILVDRSTSTGAWETVICSICVASGSAERLSSSCCQRVGRRLERAQDRGDLRARDDAVPGQRGDPEAEQRLALQVGAGRRRACSAGRRPAATGPMPLARRSRRAARYMLRHAGFGADVVAGRGAGPAAPAAARRRPPRWRAGAAAARRRRSAR